MPSRRLSNKPIKPSSLRQIVSPPASPACGNMPLTPPASRPTSPNLGMEIVRPETPEDPPPTQPLPWLWTCHLCSSTYQLGVTRRCLVDGHLFCSGISIRKDGTARRHASCNSEFDYVGWSTWQSWRRDSLDLPSESEKDCWHHCDYPSECRWGQKLGDKNKKSKTNEESQTVGKKQKKRKSKIEICNPEEPSKPANLENFDPEMKESIVETVLSGFQAKRRGCLSPIKEEDEPRSPTSPLKQQYILSDADDIPEVPKASVWPSKDTNTNDNYQDLKGDKSGIAIVVQDAPEDGMDYDTFAFYDDETPAYGEVIEDESDYSSDSSSLSPIEDPANPCLFGTDAYDLAASNKENMAGPPLRSDVRCFRRAGLRKQSFDSGYGSEVDELSY